MIDERDEQICRLLFKRIAGTISEREQAELDAWRQEDEAHEALYERMLDPAYLERQYRRRKAVDCERPRLDMQRRIRAEMQRHSRSVRYFTVSAAAAAAVLLVIFGAKIGWRSPRPAETEPVVAAAPAIRPGVTRATLTSATGERIPLGADDQADPARIETLVPKKEPGEAPRQLSLDVPRGGEFRILLEDSTEVWLNSESRLTYPESFSGTERRVAVTGEAYFRVARDEKRPFYVETDGQLVRVYGTEFNIRSYAEDRNVYTTLVSGSIALSRLDDSRSGELLLTPGHQALFNKTDEATSVKEVDTQVVTSWRHGRFVFEEQNLEQIMRDLSRWYDFDYAFEDDALRGIVFMGSIPRYGEFATALAILEKSGGLAFRVEGSHVVVARAR